MKKPDRPARSSSTSSPRKPGGGKGFASRGDAPGRPTDARKGKSEGGNRAGEAKPFRRERRDGDAADAPKSRFSKDRKEGAANKDFKKPFREGREDARRPAPAADRPRRDGSDRSERPDRREATGERPQRKRIPIKKEAAGPARPPRGTGAPRTEDPRNNRDAGADRKPSPRGDRPKRPRREEEPVAVPAPAGPMTLNKYLAHSGASSRREAAALIKEGKVSVNGAVLTEPGYRVQPADVVTFEGKRQTPTGKKVYLLLNKPKGFITTTDDEADRRTVMELVQGATEGRLYPVGRLDRNTTGLLLLTNDGDLTQRLSHPKYEAKKVYQVGLDKALAEVDFEKLTRGIDLEDGPAKVDKLHYLDTPKDLGLEIHSGRNRIVRRLFEALGYEVVTLDRVMYAGLTKKNLPRGKWRALTQEEVVRLKHFKP